jgi:ribosomal protein S18 acetylase RimI-like enzyme
MEPRPYRAYADFDKVRHILVEGRRANIPAHYVHVGDVNWWLFYPDQTAELPQRLFFWEDGDDVLGWCLLTPDEGYWDVFVHPRLYDTAQAEAMFAWAETQMTDRVRANGGDSVNVFWIAEHDRWRRAWLENRGYTLRRLDPTFERSLAAPIPTAPLPEGFIIRSSMGEAEAESRARASYAAFQSKWDWDKYLQRRLTFMRSPVYDDDRDIVAVAPDGTIAAFCIIWLDAVNKVGLFEPVGTHPDFQRLGLGRAVLHEGMRRMRAGGMETATVGTGHDNAAAVRLYPSVGFEVRHNECDYRKPVNQ